jgi:aromatic-L-amino-acid decarboxylase
VTAPTDRHRLEADRETVQAWLDAASTWALDHLDAIGDAPAGGAPDDSAAAAAVSRAIPERPLSGGMQDALEILGPAVGLSFNTPGPGYLAYVPGGGLPAAGIADLFSDWTNRYTGLTPAAPALIRLEADVLEWLCAEFGYDERAYGLFTPGGSLANFSGFVTARVDKLGDDGDYRDAIAYTSTQGHHSIQKSLALSGIPRANLIQIPCDATFRIDVEQLRRRIASDRAAGRRPFLVVANAGATNTGSVDPLPALADLCEAEDLWLHVDGAYGGAFVLSPEGKQTLAGIERADSIVFDPHKGMFLPYGTGCLLVRDRAALRRAHAGDAAYLQDAVALDRASVAPSPSDYGPELSRDFRGLRVWLPLMLYGAAAFREALSEKLALAHRFNTGLRRAIEAGAPIELVAEPQLSTVAFRLKRRPRETMSDWNDRNRRWNADINARDRVFLSSTNLDVPGEEVAAFTLRVCVLCFRTHADRIDMALEDVLATSGGD